MKDFPLFFSILTASLYSLFNDILHTWYSIQYSCLLSPPLCGVYWGDEQRDGRHQRMGKVRPVRTMPGHRFQIKYRVNMFISSYQYLLTVLTMANSHSVQWEYSWTRGTGVEGFFNRFPGRKKGFLTDLQKITDFFEKYTSSLYSDMT